MLKELHQASQYLAAAAISFTEAESDDSHTNLGWSEKYNSLFTRSLNQNNVMLALCYDDLSLQWIDASWNELDILYLSERKHHEVLAWLKEKSKKHVGDVSYNYKFHYDLPYEKITDDYIFQPVDEHEVTKIIRLTTTAKQAFELLNEKIPGGYEIRVWPHHFDLASFIELSDALSVGIGLAIPDDMLDEHYYYVTGWNKDESLATDGFRALPDGEWKNNGWKGAVLKAENNGVEHVYHFISSAIEIFKEQSH